ncbi:MAG TPA: hypothetical protein V6D07_11475 [Trichocoleus sp.]
MGRLQKVLVPPQAFSYVAIASLLLDSLKVSDYDPISLQRVRSKSY